LGVVEKAVPAKPTIPATGGVLLEVVDSSSRVLRKEFPFLKSRLPSLWTRSYYCESVGHISEETIRKYIEDQKGK